MKTRRSRLLSLATTGSLAIGLASGCGGDSSGPSGSGLDPDFLPGALGQVGTAFATNQALTSLNALGALITSVTSQPAPPAPAGIATVPAEAIGKTYVWDADLFSYVVDELRTGAPTDGVRFILYALGAGGYYPSTPLTETGYVDIRDLGAGDNIDVRHVVVIGGVTQLTFNVSGTLSSTTADLTTAGTVSGGSQSATFSHTIEMVLNGSQKLTIEAASGTISLDWAYDRLGAYATGPGKDELTLVDSQSNATIALLVNWDAAEVAQSGSTLKFNNVVVADVTGSGGFIQLLPRSGSGLDDNDALVLASAYFDIFTLNAGIIGLTRLGLASAGGRDLPGF